ncbi:MAG: HAMP domain-containing histidine kinase [Acidimicrobiales bacterium]|nr:HAMP domain-containing histidine kinase [Acidimicrobiales bacterium]
MRRRILVAIVAVTALGVVGFGVPLALVLGRLYQDEAVTDLERQADRAAVEVPASSLTSDDPVELPAPEGSTSLALYNASNERLLGDGPAQGDPTVQRALRGEVNDDRHGGLLVVAVPVTSEEQVFAVVRAARPASEVRAQLYRVWLAMAGLGLLIIALAAIVARWQAGRLSRPVLDLVDAAERLGDGDFSARVPPSGVAELDVAGRALGDTAERLGALVTRERAFSADASHQLRTPLTGLRLLLENTGNDGADQETVREAIHEVDRLEQTIEDLLGLARDIDRPRDLLDLDTLFADAERDWHGRFAAEARPLRVSISPAVPAVRASRRALRQILEVLLANALEHGGGVVTLAARPTAAGLSIEVSDEGPGVVGDVTRLFRRRASRATRGIGLPLAATLADGEGARLSLRAPGAGPVFTLLLPAASASRDEGLPSVDSAGSGR